MPRSKINHSLRSLVNQILDVKRGTFSGISLLDRDKFQADVLIWDIRILVHMYEILCFVIHVCMFEIFADKLHAFSCQWCRRNGCRIFLHSSAFQKTNESDRTKPSSGSMYMSVHNSSKLCSSDTEPLRAGDSSKVQSVFPCMSKVSLEHNVLTYLLRMKTKHDASGQYTVEKLYNHLFNLPKLCNHLFNLPSFLFSEISQ